MLFEDIQYDISKYPGIGYDATFKDDATNLLKERIIDLLIDGKSTGYIAGRLSEELGFKAYGAKMLTNKCYTLMKNMSKRCKDDIIDKNYQRITRVYVDAMENGDRQNALKALDMLNKMGGAYTQKVEVTSTEFEIKLND